MAQFRFTAEKQDKALNILLIVSIALAISGVVRPQIPTKTKTPQASANSKFMLTPLVARQLPEFQPLTTTEDASSDSAAAAKSNSASTPTASQPVAQSSSPNKTTKTATKAANKTVSAVSESTGPIANVLKQLTSPLPLQVKAF